jgi:8-oxo-dGTP diphosphatase
MEPARCARTECHKADGSCYPRRFAPNREETTAMPDGIDLRCSTILLRDESVLLVHRTHDGADDWVLPGGTPRLGESMAACARRELSEETGITADPARVAFVLEAVEPGSGRRTVDLVFIARGPASGQQPEHREAGLEPQFVPLARLPGLDLRPPVAGYLRGMRARGVPSAPYLGNLWRPEVARLPRFTGSQPVSR